jgi:hypothetical protein
MNEVNPDLQEYGEQFDGENVVVDSTIVMRVSASQDASIRDSIVGVAVAGDALNISGSVGSTYVAGGDLHIQGGTGGLMVVGGDANLENSNIGILVGGNDVILAEGSKVVVTLPVAIMFAAVTGITLGLVSYLLGRQKS